MEPEERIKANWGKLSSKFFKSIILDIVDDIGASPEYLIMKYARDKKKAEKLIKNDDSHTWTNEERSEEDMSVDSDSEEHKVPYNFNASIPVNSSRDPLSWDNIESLFNEPIQNTLTKHIRHGKVLLQTSPFLCGYHTYFSMKNTIESLLTDNPKDKIYYHLRNNLRSEFWSEYERTKKFLLNNWRMGEQDRESLIDDGSLERYMLRFLLANDPDLIRILGTYDVHIEWVPLFFGFGLFQGEVSEIKEAAQVLKDFHNTKKPFLLPIVLGVVNHWNILLAFKRDAESEPQLIFLDSRNIEVLNIDEFDINDFVENRDTQLRELTGRPKSSEFFKKWIKNCLFDLRMILYTLEDVIYTQRYDLKQLYTKRVIHNILKSFSRSLEDILVPKVAVGDESRSAVLKRRFLELKDPVLKQKMQEFLPYVLDWDTDFAPLFGLRTGSKEATDSLLSLANWLVNYHEPYHLRKAIVGTIQKLGRCVADEDLDLLLFWAIGTEHLANCLDKRFRRNYPDQAFAVDQLTYVLDDIKEAIQKVMDK